MDKIIGYIPEQLDLLKLLVSILVGGTIGIEREYRGKSAGFRTIILICIGSTLFTIFSIQLGSPNNSDRIAANIITGIGFLGAGAIFRDINNLTRGLNTATIIWITAALGLGIGAGHFIIVILSTVILIIILTSFPKLEILISRKHQVRIYKISFRDNDSVLEMEKCFKKNGLTARVIKHMMHDNTIVCHWTVAGSESNQVNFANTLCTMKGPVEFEYS
jgi:putative Mg2+ transporter-C (MgtC) family protein